MRLKDRVAIVTGGAKGIGAETARTFAAEGARVIVWDVVGQVPGDGIVFRQVDVTDAHLYLASDDASFVNGAVLSVDGGVVVGT